MKLFILPFFALILFACSSTPKEIKIKKTRQVHSNLVQANTQSAQKYKGIYNIFRIHMTLLKPEVRRTENDLLAVTYQWSQDEIEDQNQKTNNEMNTKTKVYISFYTPVAKDNDLSRGKQSIWKVYLEYNGTQYPAHIETDKHKYTYISQLYPHHTTFDKAYIATFDIPTSTVSNGDVKLVLTGVKGATSFNFN